MLRSATRARANANADDGAHAATIGDVLEVAANTDDGAYAADDGAHAPENEVKISSTLAQLRILIRLIHHVELRCLIGLSESVAWIVGRVVRIEASCDSIVGSLDTWID